MNSRNFNDNSAWDNTDEWDNIDDIENANNDLVSETGRNQQMFDPYDMDRHDVRAKYFNDARLYDDNINGSGWKIDNQSARTKYRQWLANVRREPGWEGFHRPPREVIEEVEGDDGKSYTIRKIVPYRVPGVPYRAPYTIGNRRETSKNRKTPMLPQSKVKGATIDDENFRAKMFTLTMGKEIAQLRNHLGLTQVELAKKINVDAPTIRNIELGGLVTFNSEDKMVKELARALNVPSIKYQD